MAKWRLRGCPKCGGDMVLEEDHIEGWMEICLQCGHRINFQRINNPLPPMSDEEIREAMEAGRPVLVSIDRELKEIKL